MLKERRNQILFLAAFALIGLGAMQVPFSQLVGAPSSIRFSLFDFYGPIAGAFVGSPLGLVVVAFMQLLNWAVKGFSMDMGVIIRMFPMFFAVWYFAKPSRSVLAVPVIAIIAFLAHPEGRMAWYYTLYWLIPLAMHFLRDRFLYARALGATFTAHSVGGALWIWTFNMKAALWIGLIPVVWKERMLMALGIMLTFVVFNHIFAWLKQHTRLPLSFISTESRYLWHKK